MRNAEWMEGYCTIIRMSTPQPKSILITGCSTGFGRITALHLAKRGWRVFATVRKESDRESLLKEWGELRELKEIGELAVFLCDITDEKRVAELGRQMAAATLQLDALINNAGTAYASPLELLPVSDLR